MKAPIHPHQRPGYHIPQREIVEEKDIELPGYRYSLNELHLLWELKREQALGNLSVFAKDITFDGPYFTTKTAYRTNLHMEFTVKYRNDLYEDQLQQNRLDIEQYEADRVRYTEWQREQRRIAINDRGEGIDAKIEKTRRRLANLLATKEGKPLPFPEVK